MKKFRIKKNDKVVVISGKDKGKEGVVLKVITKDSKVLVSKVNVAKKHAKQTQATKGGIIEVEMPIHVSNVSLLCPKTSKPTRVFYKTLSDGKKIRCASKSGETIEN